MFPYFSDTAQFLHMEGPGRKTKTPTWNLQREKKSGHTTYMVRKVLSLTVEKVASCLGRPDCGDDAVGNVFSEGVVKGVAELASVERRDGDGFPSWS